MASIVEVAFFSLVKAGGKSFVWEPLGGDAFENRD